MTLNLKLGEPVPKPSNPLSEDEIMCNWGTGFNVPVVSICCVTYNHGYYIEDALNGFLNQETDFPFEILIHDDASNDGTSEVIRKYEKKYPNLIKPIYQNKNQFSKGIKINPEFNFPRAKGKYIALCEGDDYWVNREKLKTQVEEIEKSDCDVCFHEALKLDSASNKCLGRMVCKKEPKKLFTPEEILDGGVFFIPTAALLIKTDFLLKKEVLDFLKNKGSSFVIKFLASERAGALCLSSNEMSCYRVASLNSHTLAVLKDNKLALKMLLEVNDNFEDINYMTGYKYDKSIQRFKNRRLASLLYSGRLSRVEIKEIVAATSSYANLYNKIFFHLSKFGNKYICLVLRKIYFSIYK